MALIQFKEFADERVVVDGEEYETCTFKGCRLVFTGGAVPMFYDCAFPDSRFELTGAALSTIGFLTAMWTIGNEAFVNGLFDAIRSVRQFQNRPVN